MSIIDKNMSSMHITFKRGMARMSTGERFCSVLPLVILGLCAVVGLLAVYDNYFHQKVEAIDISASNPPLEALANYTVDVRHARYWFMKA
jgi:hypothetical protein